MRRERRRRRRRRRDDVAPFRRVLIPAGSSVSAGTRTVHSKVSLPGNHKHIYQLRHTTRISNMTRSDLKFQHNLKLYFVILLLN